MDIILSGELYIYFVKSIFESNKKIGFEIIIDKKKSDSQLIRELTRLNQINQNKIIIYNINNINITYTKYKATCEFTYLYNNNQLILNKIFNIEPDKINIPVIEMNKKIYVNKFTTSKQKTINNIMEIIKTI